MSFLNIDQNKCKRDGICAAECPAQIIIQGDKNSFPSLLENGEDMCINCGHCVAICPHGALSLAAMPAGGCTPIEHGLLPGSGVLKQLLKARRSIRQFKKTPVPRNLIADLLDTARYAPTASNRQQVQWMVYENPADVRECSAHVIDFTKLILPGVKDKTMAMRLQRLIAAWDKGTDRVMRGAPHLVLAHSPADLPGADADSVIALTYLELYAYANKLGTCWSGYFVVAANMHAPLIKALALPSNHKCYGAVMLGYPQYDYFRIPERNEPLITWR